MRACSSAVDSDVADASAPEGLIAVVPREEVEVDLGGPPD